MIVLIAALVGAVLGATTAKRRKGNAADMAQYAAGFGIFFALLGVVATIVIDKAVL
ncbi:apolipoprotein acyltransferase [Thalassococcus sp. BH17M4-6]|uniref:apolipoprotein acyltransferase n=1 Tax=Thalassococcus sp. BH17M4-6 TaxID=3413148 RepID=UPI003BD21C54